MSTYRINAEGQIVNDAIVFIQHNPTLVMYVSSPVSLRDDMICGRVERSDLEAAHYELDGARATAAETRAITDAIWTTFAGMGEICSRYHPDGDAFDITVNIDGVAQPDLADRMIWIRPEDGYTIDAAEASET
jgi:hypothetical protein